MLPSQSESGRVPSCPTPPRVRFTPPRKPKHPVVVCLCYIKRVSGPAFLAHIHVHDAHQTRMHSHARTHTYTLGGQLVANLANAYARLESENRSNVRPLLRHLGRLATSFPPHHLGLNHASLLANAMSRAVVPPPPPSPSLHLDSSRYSFLLLVLPCCLSRSFSPLPSLGTVGHGTWCDGRKRGVQRRVS